MISIHPITRMLAELVIRAELQTSGLIRHEAAVAGQPVSYLGGGKSNRKVGARQLPILMLHGFGGDALSFVRYARRLVSRHRGIVPDLPGFGESGWAKEGRYSIAAYADLMASLLDELGIDRVHVAANSMGGHVAWLLAARHPGRVGSLVLFAPAGLRQSDDHWDEDRLEPGDHPLKIFRPADYDRLLETLFVKRPFLPGPLKTYLAAQAIARQPLHQEVWRDLAAETDENRLVEGLLPDIAAPALVVWGDRDQLLPLANAETYRRLKPHCQVRILRGCGHLPMIECAREMAEMTLQFLDGRQDSAAAGQTGAFGREGKASPAEAG